MTNEEKREEKRKELLGAIKRNSKGTLMKIIEYNTSKDITVEFLDENHAKVKSYMNKWKDGEIKNPFYPYTCGVGYMGYAESKIDGKRKISHYHWGNMIKRCYSKNKKEGEERYSTYLDCEVCDWWKCYANFEIDYGKLEKEYNFPKDLTLCLDKDILNKGNKIYSPDNCVLVPNFINVLFIKSNKSRGSFPVGVSYNKKNSTYISTLSIKNKQVYLGSFKTPEEAFYVYKEAKEKEIKRVANECAEKGWITKESRLYKAMMSWEVEITD